MTSSSTESLSFEGVARELSSPLERYLERLTGDHATAEDLLQETLVKIARALPQFEGRSSIKTWAFSIATRTATDHFRRHETKARIVEFDEGPELPVLDSEIEGRLVVEEMSSCVRGVIDGLPEGLPAPDNPECDDDCRYGPSVHYFPFGAGLSGFSFSNWIFPAASAWAMAAVIINCFFSAACCCICMASWCWRA